MERAPKRKKLEYEKSHSTDINMPDNANRERSSPVATYHSGNDSQSISTSPILDTTRVRRKGKSGIRRRFVGNASNSSSEVNINKHHEEDDKNVWKNNKNKEMISTEQEISSPSGNLVDRLRDLKRYKKSVARSPILNDARVTDEEFVESVRLLDRACDLTPVVQPQKNCKTQIGLVSFAEHEQSMHEAVQRNKSPSITHLSLDEDKEEDIFADSTGSPEAAEVLEEFSQWRYSPADNSPSSFHGFSQEECKCSQEKAERRSQLQDSQSSFRGFTSRDADRSKSILRNWKSVVTKHYSDFITREHWFTTGSRKQFSDSEFSADQKPSSHRKPIIPEIVTETADILSKQKTNLKQSSCEFKPKNVMTSRNDFEFVTTGERSINVSAAAIAKAKLLLSEENESIEDDNKSRDKLTSDSISNVQSKCGFSTTGGRPSCAAMASLAKAKTRSIQENVNIQENLPDFEFYDLPVSQNPEQITVRKKSEFVSSKVDDSGVNKNIKILRNNATSTAINNQSTINFGFKTAGGREIKTSEQSWLKAKAQFDAIEIPNVTMIPEEKNKSTKNITSNNKAQMIDTGFSTAGGRTIRVATKAVSAAEAQYDAIDISSVAMIPEVKNKSTKIVTAANESETTDTGFLTASGRSIRVAKKAASAAEAQYDAIEIPSVATIPEVKNKSTKIITSNNKTETTDTGFSTAGGRTIRVASKAVSAAEAQYDAIDISTGATVPEVKNKSTKTVASTSKAETIDTGFATAGGRTIRVAAKAVSAAEAQYATMEILNVTTVPEVKNKSAKIVASNNKAETIDTGFSTAGGRTIRVAKKAVSAAEAQYVAIETPSVAKDPEEKDQSTNIDTSSNKAGTTATGFSTASGRTINVAKKAVSVAEAQYDAIEVPSVAMGPEVKNEFTNTITSNNKTETIASGFSTAGGRTISIAKKAVTAAEAQYDATDIPSVGIGPEVKNEFTNTITSNNKTETIASGFSTAGGRTISIAKKAVTAAEAQYDAIEIPSVAMSPKAKDEFTNINTSNKKAETIATGFSTAGGRTINVALKAVSAAEAQFQTEIESLEFPDFEDFEQSAAKPETSKKRKLEETEEETPSRKEASLKWKRGRYVDELQGRKLFIEAANEDDGNAKDSSEFVGLTRNCSDKTMMSAEVVASAAALLEDEERSNEEWRTNSPLVDQSKSPEFGRESHSRHRTDVSRISIEAGSREMEKVNDDRGRDSIFSRNASGSSANTKEPNDTAVHVEKREETKETQVESIPDDLMFDSEFSQDIPHSPLIDKFIVETMKIMEGRFAMASKQDVAIREKRRVKPEACDGFLYRLRSTNRQSRISWEALTDGMPPAPREIAEDSLRSITAQSAVNYSFHCADFYGEKNVRTNIEGIEVGDGAFLILDENNCVGVREFERAFLASPAVDPNLVPTGWVRNHYRWIVWKLASMDRMKFGHKCLPRMLTPHRVMLELKYRYDREIYRTQWPPLRRILERGEDASARLVLCVSSIVAEEGENTPIKGLNTPKLMISPAYRMEVTDGWYSIPTLIDAAMTTFIKSGKVREGTKLMICGAKVTNLDQGCSALEIPEAVTLRIYSNSVRRARWNAKLDYYRDNRGPMSFTLKSVKPNGGTICKMTVAVSRVYPILYREKLSDGKSVFRNARCDEEAARAHEARYQSKMEEIYATAYREFQIEAMRKKSNDTNRRASYMQEEATAFSGNMEEELRRKIASKMSECLPTPRDVTPVMKIRIADAVTSALMTVWTSDRDTAELFVEGSTIAIHNAFASGLRSNELQITAGRSTLVRREVSRRVSYPERIYATLADVTDPGFNPVYGEFDTIGIVSSTGPAPHGMKNFETVNLSCPKPGDASASDFLSVLFWQGVSAHGYAKILTVGSLVACSNLEWRRNTSRSIPTAYCTERSVFSKNPRQSHLVQAFESLHREIKDPLGYATACAAVIEEETARKSALRTPGGSTPYKPATTCGRTPGWSPRDSTISIDSNCNTPGIDSRKAVTRKRLEKLEAYGEPPKLPSIVLNNSSPRVLSEFRSPMVTPVTKSSGT